MPSKNVSFTITLTSAEVRYLTRKAWPGRSIPTAVCDLVRGHIDSDRYFKSELSKTRRCSRCGEMVMPSFSWGGGQIIKKPIRYCPGCGKRLNALADAFRPTPSAQSEGITQCVTR